MQLKRTLAVTLGIVVLVAVAAFSHLAASHEAHAAGPDKEVPHGTFLLDSKTGQNYLFAPRRENWVECKKR